LSNAVRAFWRSQYGYYDHTRESPMGVKSWTVTEAKARFSELIEQAQSKGPQTITKRGRRAAIVVSADEWDKKSKRSGNLAEFFAGSPLRESGLEIKRRRDEPRKTSL
jgi:prevent-host-death family protein